MRAILFAGDVVRIDGFPKDARTSKPLPTGLQLADGQLTGVALAPHRGDLYDVQGVGLDGTIYLEIVAPLSSQDLVVAPNGDDRASGTLNQPLRTISHALERSGPGTRIFLRAGRYSEDVAIRRGGNRAAPLILRSYPGERAIIDGNRIDLSWRRANEVGAAPDELISTIPLPVKQSENVANRGAFLDRTPYTRLLSYWTLEDLRADNERWDLSHGLPGPLQTKQPARPWTYFGPGLWHDSNSGFVHLRLSATHNRVTGVSNFDGRYRLDRLGIAVWFRSSIPLAIQNARYVEVRDLSVFGGGAQSVDIQHASDVVLDHVDIFAASVGLTIRHSSRVRYLHGRIDGGLPPWTFRSDYKDSYDMVSPNGVSPNHLIRKTSRALLAVGSGNASIEIGYAELANGHDNTFAGIGGEFHHCLIDNVHDDALFISHTTDIDALEIHHNVFRRVLTGFSGEGQRPTGAKYIHHNVFDLRDAVGGFRPGLKPEVWRWGTLFKGDFSAGPLFFYQNTVLLNRPGEQAAIMLYRSLEPNGAPVNPRWFVNNVVAVDTTARDQALGFVPASEYINARQPNGMPVLWSDGNIWVRTGDAHSPLFRCMSRASRCTTREWRDLRSLHTLGFERRSLLARQAFVRLRSPLRTSTDDDLRLIESPHLADVGVEIPSSLPGGSRSPGALAPNAPALFVGVDGRSRF